VDRACGFGLQGIVGAGENLKGDIKMPTTWKDIEEMVAYGSAKILRGLGATESIDELLADRPRLWASMRALGRACRRDEDNIDEEDK